ncbi:MAG: HDIG domain-containing protein [Nitrospirae bacterium]|nr:HDIG domain-containing protein [Nitrospirota bacterium]
MIAKADIEGIIRKYYEPGSLSYEVYTGHAAMVVRKALAIAGSVKHPSPDLTFIEEAAYLHDIGIFMTNAPRIGCNGESHYICHGYLGRELLEKEGLPDHALVCERHIGAGLSITDITVKNLPLPRRDMLPISIEEKIICYADKFFSKNIGELNKEKSEDEIRAEITKFGPESLRRFEELHALFSR